jgi:RNA polymerase sigma-70 factor, ECF subfamily
MSLDPLAESMARAQRGERGAFDDLVRSLHGPVYGYAQRALGDPERAQEVAQETFVRAFRYRDSYRPQRGSVRAWLFAIAANRVRDALSARRDGALPLDEAGDVPDQAALEAASREGLREEISLALESLPAEQREVIALRYLADLSYEEVAEVLGVSPGAARMRALRAREALAQILGRAGEAT